METEYPFGTGRSCLLGTEAFRNLLGTSLKNAKKKIIILSAYVTQKGVKWMREQIIDSKVKCTIVTRWDKEDLALGSSDLDCYLLAKEKNWDFKVLNNLHAKVMLVDDKDLFIGSQNLTSRGMSLAEIANKEIGIKLAATKNDIHTIKTLSDDSINIDDKLFSEYKKWKEKLPKIQKVSLPDFPQQIKNKLKENYNKIWVHDFPWSTPDELLNTEALNENIIHDLDLFGLNKNNITKEKLKSAFLESKVYKWFINQILQTENKEIYFGNFSSIIHNSLLDDPKPYRKTVKDFQSNINKFIKFFDFKHLKIDIPGTKSERIIYINE